MKVTIIGYGKMGKEIEKILLRAGHEVLATIDPSLNLSENLMSEKLSSSSLIIFSALMR